MAPSEDFALKKKALELAMRNSLAGLEGFTLVACAGKSEFTVEILNVAPPSARETHNHHSPQPQVEAESQPLRPASTRRSG